MSLYADSLAACDVCCVCCGQCSPLCRPTTRSQVSWSEVCTHCFREKFCISSPSTVAAWVCSCVSLTVVVLVSLRFGECTPACLPACMHACVCVCACVFFHLHLRVIVHRVIRYEDVPIFHVQPTIIPVTLPPPQSCTHNIQSGITSEQKDTLTMLTPLCTSAHRTCNPVSLASPVGGAVAEHPHSQLPLECAEKFGALMEALAKRNGPAGKVLSDKWELMFQVRVLNSCCCVCFCACRVIVGTFASLLPCDCCPASCLSCLAELHLWVLGR